MRDKVNSVDFCKSVEKNILALLQMETEDLRSDVVDNSNFHSDNLTFYFLKDLKFDDFIRLSLLSWYLPVEVRFVLQMDLREKLRYYSLEDRTILELFLTNKAIVLEFLQSTQLWHSRDFFGNILNKKNKLDRFFKLSPLRRKIKRPQRKRGYHDHGSRVPDHKWKPREDYYLNKEQNIIESERISQRDTALFLEGMLI